MAIRKTNSLYGTSIIPNVDLHDIGAVSELDGKVFIVEASRSFSAGVAESGSSWYENILGLIYSGSNVLFIDHILVSTNSNLSKVEVYVNATGISGSVNDTPTNLTIGGDSANVTASTGEGIILTGSIATDNKLINIYLNNNVPNYIYKFDGALALSVNENILIRGRVSASGEIIETSVVYYERVID